MLRLPSSIRYISSYAAVSVVASVGYSIYRTAEPAKRLPFVNEAFSALMGLQLYRLMAKKGKPFTGTLLALSGSYAMLRGLEKFDRRQLAMFYGAIMICALVVEWLSKPTEPSIRSEPISNLVIGDPEYPPSLHSA